ncbi:MAG TPA: plastocyanin/azurin family copper-binding protein [Actinomycetota bacterium]|nr:plastocyanin/azurin family copper-binding protein [Actinomycetota bacterium]
MNRTRTTIVIGVLAIAVAACSSDAATEESPPSRDGGSSAVRIDTFRFGPEVLEVAVGTEVTWTNEDDIEHTATSGTPGSPDGTFDGELDGPGARFTFTFENAGVFAYFCDVHQGMRGEIRVT